MNPLDPMLDRLASERYEVKNAELWKHDWYIAGLLESYRQRFAYVRCVVTLERRLLDAELAAR